MALPIAHGLAGASVIVAFIPRVSINRDWRLLLLGAIAAICPDFDYIFYLGFGFGEEWHRSFTHSFTFAIITGIILAAWTKRYRKKDVIVYSLVVLSHPLLDTLTTGDSGGVEMFWPFSTQRVRFSLVNYYSELLSPAPRPLADILLNFFKICALEAIVFIPLFLLVIWIRRNVRVQA